MKAADIPAELVRFIEERRSQPFAWGANDCCLFAADWVARATGRDPAAHYRGTYSSGIGAQRIIDKAGGILELARELGLEPGKPAPTGGSAYSLVNLEADFPLWNKVRGTLFFDSGSLSPDGLTVPTSNFRSAVGLGLRYALPVGPIRLDVGINPSPRPAEAWGATNLSFGFAF
jgi:outer membrane protein assembly factor BamA